MIRAVVVDMDGIVWSPDGTMHVFNEPLTLLVEEGGWLVDKSKLKDKPAYPRWRRESPIVQVDVSGGERVEARDPRGAVHAGLIQDVSDLNGLSCIEATSPVGYAAYWHDKGARVGRKVNGEILWMK